jgi:hypothetical protein
MVLFAALWEAQADVEQALRSVTSEQILKMAEEKHSSNFPIFTSSHISNIQCHERFGIWPLVSGSLVCRHFGGLLSICSKSLSALVDFYILLTVSTSGAAQASGNLLPPLLFFVATTSRGIYIYAHVGEKIFGRTVESF